MKPPGTPMKPPGTPMKPPGTPMKVAKWQSGVPLSHLDNSSGPDASRPATPKLALGARAALRKFPAGWQRGVVDC
jgi:hypothetical protein